MADVELILQSRRCLLNKQTNKNINVLPEQKACSREKTSWQERKAVLLLRNYRHLSLYIFPSHIFYDITDFKYLEFSLERHTHMNMPPSSLALHCLFAQAHCPLSLLRGSPSPARTSCVNPWSYTECGRLGTAHPNLSGDTGSADCW